MCRPSISIWNIDFQASVVSCTFKAEALATMTSMPPLCSAQESTQDFSCCSSDKSTTAPMAFAFGKSDARFSLAALMSDSLRAQKCVVAPSSRNALTISRPIPLVPPIPRQSSIIPALRHSIPVTRTILLSSSRCIFVTPRLSFRLGSRRQKSADILATAFLSMQRTKRNNRVIANVYILSYLLPWVR